MNKAMLKNHQRSLRRFVVTSLSVGLLFCSTACEEAAATASSRPDIYKVVDGNLRITISESAEIQAAKETRVKSEVEGSATVIYLIPEGTVVKAGEKLIELDASSLVDRKATQEISLERAKASLVQAEQNMEIQKKEIKASEETAKSKLLIAEMEREKFFGKLAAGNGADGDGFGESSNGQMVQKLKELVADDSHYADLPAEIVKKLLPNENDLRRDMGEMSNQVLAQIDKIRLAESELKVREDTLGHSERLAKKGYVTKNELDKDRLSYNSQLSKVTLSKNDLDLLVNYTLRKQKIQLTKDVENTTLELDRVRATNLARQARELAELKSKQAEHKLANERFENLVYQIKNAVIHAPNPGLVVYATQGDGRRGREVVEEGLSVRERQTLIILPDVSKMECDLKVKEADVDKVAVGQRVAIRVDAFPGQPFTGTVSRVSPLPDSGSRWSNNDLKVYKTRVTIDGVNEQLRPGMSSRIEIVIGEIKSATYVPMQAVRRQGSVQYIWKQTPAGPVAEKVAVGQNNLTHVQILKGLTAGESVYLTPPSGVVLPEFSQPLKADPAKPKADPAKPASDPAKPASAPPGDRSAGRDRSREGDRPRGEGGFREVMEKMSALLASKYPRFSDEVKGDPSALFRNAEIRELIQNDPELKAMQEKMRGSMSGRGGDDRGAGEGHGGGAAPTGRRGDDGGGR